MEAALDVLRRLGAELAECRVRPLASYFDVKIIVAESEIFSVHQRDLIARPGDFGADFRARALPAVLFSASDYVQATLRATAEPGACTLIGHAGGFNVATAALCNGTAAHGEDYDDTFEGGPVHAGAVIIPALLAAGEQHSLAGSDVADWSLRAKQQPLPDSYVLGALAASVVFNALPLLQETLSCLLAQRRPARAVAPAREETRLEPRLEPRL